MNLQRWLKKIARLYDSDRRSRIRIPAEYGAILSGEFGAFPVQGIDAHRDGVAVRAERALPVGARLFLRIPQHSLGGFAEVRRCSPESDGSYVLGLALLEPLARGRADFEERVSSSAASR